MSFPAGKYARYKRATAFFLDWLLRARGRGRHSSQRVELEALDAVVTDIAAEPSTLSPKLLQELPKALAACQCAIVLRKHVATFFPEDDEAQEGHQHFLRLLISWFKTLQTVATEPEEASVAEVKSKGLENYYQVLQVDEDFFPDEAAYVVESDAPKTAKKDREKLFEEAFADELRMEIVYLFMEVDELLEAVCKVYADVKKEKKTLVEASVVVKLAMDTVSALTAKLQLRYPSLRAAKDMYNIVRNISPKSFRQKILGLHESIMHDVADTVAGLNDKTPKYVSGTFLIELLGVGMSLETFLLSVPVDTAKSIFFPNEVFGEAYGEDRTPLYVLVPDTNSEKPFLMQQLPLLYNSVAERRRAAKLGHELAPMGPFMTVMDKFFTSREVTLPVVFASICWMKSVAGLQGKGGLGRNISLSFKHSKDLLKKIDAAVASGRALVAYNKANSLLLRCAAEIKQSANLHHLASANPLFAGFTMLNHHFQFLHIANEVMFATSRFRAFGHLYNALVQEGYLDRIPFFDKILEIYGQEVFTPSRGAAVHGAYNRTYLLSLNVRASSIEAVYRGEDLPVEAFKKRKAFHLSDVSQIFRLVRLNDKSVLKRGSWTAMLDDVSDICSRELFDTRVLSRDLLKLNEDLMDTFPEMIKVLGQQDHFQEILANPIAGESRQQRVARALEDSVMHFMMPILDALQPDGSIDMSAFPGEKLASASWDVTLVKSLCAEVSAVIKTRFATPPQICEQKYFTFPSQPDFASQEYGKIEDRSKSDDDQQLFDDLMKLLSESDGPLSESDMEYLKSELKKNPDLMGMMSERPLPDVDRMYGDLCSLLHQAAAGPAHDADLVEWMIQMGGLLIQPTMNCRKPPRHQDLEVPLVLYPNTMAVHNAAIAGYTDVVRVMLGADNMRDLNTPTFHTKETLAHLAVKYGHRDLFSILQAFGADLRIRDGDGRRVSDVASDSTWARQLAASTKQYTPTRQTGARSRNSMLREHNASRLEGLRRPASKPSSERQNVPESSSVTTAKGKKNKKKKSKKGKKDAPREESMIAAAAEQSGIEIDMVRVFMCLLGAAGFEVDESLESESATRLEDKLRKLEADLFARLRDPNIPASDKTDDVRNASELLKALKSLVTTYSDPTRVNLARDHVRLVIATEAVHGVHMMQKFYRVAQAAVELAPVRELCDTTLDFVKFVTGTAKLCVAIERRPQAREVMDVLEKRLLKTPFAERPPAFREFVQAYSAARDVMGLGKTASAETFRALEWYLTNVYDLYDLMLKFDAMAGRPLYFECKVTPETSDMKYMKLGIGLYETSELNVVAALNLSDKRLIYGGTSKADVTRIRKLVRVLAEKVEVKLDEQNMQFRTSVRVEGFVFSDAGIRRAE